MFRPRSCSGPSSLQTKPRRRARSQRGLEALERVADRLLVGALAGLVLGWPGSGRIPGLSRQRGLCLGGDPGCELLELRDADREVLAPLGAQLGNRGGVCAIQLE